jgi:hypothetical protein
VARLYVPSFDPNPEPPIPNPFFGAHPKKVAPFLAPQKSQKSRAGGARAGCEMRGPKRGTDPGLDLSSRPVIERVGGQSPFLGENSWHGPKKVGPLTPRPLSHCDEKMRGEGRKNKKAVGARKKTREVPENRATCGEEAPLGVEPRMADLQSAALASWLRRHFVRIVLPAVSWGQAFKTPPNGPAGSEKRGILQDRSTRGPVRLNQLFRRFRRDSSVAKHADSGPVATATRPG